MKSLIKKPTALALSLILLSGCTQTVPSETETVTDTNAETDAPVTEEISGLYGEDDDMYNGDIPTASMSGKSYVLRYDEPADDSYNGWETQSLPVGNSSIGGNVFGRYDTEQITLNEKTFWTGGPSSSRPNYMGGNVTSNGNYGKTLSKVQSLFLEGKIAEGEALCEKLVGTWDGYGGYQLFGNLYFDFGDVSKSEISDYSRSLDLSTGIAHVSYEKNGTAYEREVFTSYPDNVMVIHLTATGTEKLDFTLSIVPENDSIAPRVSRVKAEGRSISCTGKLTDNGLRYCAYLTVDTDKNGLTEASASKLTVSGASEVTVILSMATDYANDYPEYRTGESVDELSARVRETVEAADKNGYKALRGFHVADVWELMGRVSVDLGGVEIPTPTDDLLSSYKKGGLDQKSKSYLEELLYVYGRYLLVSSSRGDTLPANLQGMWVGKNGSDWSSDYHINVNLQMNYWHAYSTNLAECAHPLIDYVDGLREPGRVTAEIYFGVKSDEENPENGFTANTQTTPFGWTCPGWSFDWGWSPAAVPWIIQNVWEYYEYTLDEDILCDRIYPIMKEQAVFYAQILVEDENGELISTPSYSPEHGPRTNGNTYEQALVWQLFTDTVTAAKIVGEDEDVIAEWQDILSRLKEPIEIGDDGQIKEWYHETTLGSVKNSDAFGHRHLSHLLGLFPGDLISDKTPEWLDAARISLDARVDTSTGWAMGQRINTWARLGDGEKVYDLIGLLFQNGILDNLWDTHPPFQIDGNFGYTAGVTEALMQSNTGTIKLLPALPDEWANGSAKGLVARGNFEISMTWTDKVISSVQIISGSGGECVLAFTAGTVTVTDSDGNAVEYTVTEDGEYSFATVEGGVYTVKNLFAVSAPADFSAKRTSETSVALSWSATDCADGYAVYRSLNGGEFVRIIDTADTSVTDTDASFELVSDVYTYKVVAYIADGTLGAFSVEASAGGMGNETVDSSDPRILYGGSWTVFNENDHYMGTNQCSWTPGSTAEFTFTGTGIELYSVAKPNYNALYITVDGVAYAEYHSVRAEKVTPDTLVFAARDLEFGEHTIRIEVMSEKVTPANDHSISIDYFKVYCE